MTIIKTMSDERIKAKVSEYHGKLEHLLDSNANPLLIKRAQRNYDRYFAELHKRENCEYGHDYEFMGSDEGAHEWGYNQRYICKRCGDVDIVPTYYSQWVEENREPDYWEVQ